VGDADDGDLGDARVLDQRPLDLRRVDVLAAGDQHVLEPVDHIDEAFPVGMDEVAAVEPAAGECLGGRLRLLEVAR
jgi:hypothetical protein